MLEVHDLRFDLATREVARGTSRLIMRSGGKKLLEALMRASPALVTREELEIVLLGEHPPDRDMLRSHVYELRRSVDGPFVTKLIHTLPKAGYRIAAPTGALDAPRSPALSPHDPTSLPKRPQRLIEIRDQVVHVFDADGNPDQAVTDAERATAFR